VNLKSLIGALITIAGVSPVLAQSGNSINPPTTPQTAPMTASEQKNLDMVLKWWREVIEAHHTELAETYQAEDYIQHNPNVPTGRAAFIKLFSGVPPTNPMPEHLTHPPVIEGAKGEFVWLVFEDDAKDPHAYSPISLPIPDCLKPPKGAAASKTSKQLIHTVPTRATRITRVGRQWA
jgi:predicted SnoaL-like aldol condensation-catalyzing enzyme